MFELAFRAFLDCITPNKKPRDSENLRGSIDCILRKLFLLGFVFGVVVAGSRVAGQAVHLALFIHSLVHLGDERTLRIVHLGDVVASAANGEVVFNHLLAYGFSHVRTTFNLLFRSGEVALNFTKQGDASSLCLVEEHQSIVNRADVFIGVVLEVAVGTACGHAGSGAVVLTLLVGLIGRIHGVAEFSAELRGARPVNYAGENANEDDADYDAHEADACEVPFAVFFHLLTYVVRSCRH